MDWFDVGEPDPANLLGSAGGVPVPKNQNHLQRHDFRTPKFVFEYASQMWGPFDLDAAANAENALCSTYHTERDDSLLQEWNGWVWCNPPYCKRLKPKFFKKALDEIAVGRCKLVCFLVPASTANREFFRLVEAGADITFIVGRLNFHGPYTKNKSGATFGSALIRLPGSGIIDFIKRDDMKNP